MTLQVQHHSAKEWQHILQYKFKNHFIIFQGLFLIIQMKSKNRSIQLFVLQFLKLQNGSYSKRHWVMFGAEIMSSCFKNVTCDVHYKQIRKDSRLILNAIDWCLTTCQYGKNLHASNVHGVMWLSSGNTIIKLTSGDKKDNTKGATRSFSKEKKKDKPTKYCATP